MADRVLFTTRNANGRVTSVTRREEGGLLIAHHQNNLEAIAEQCKREASAFDPIAHRANAGKSEQMTKVASIPIVVWQDLCRRGIAHNTRLLNAWLDRRDARVFRTDDGRRLS